jgi:hypothetical protein
VIGKSKLKKKKQQDEERGTKVANSHRMWSNLREMHVRRSTREKELEAR